MQYRIVLSILREEDFQKFALNLLCSSFIWQLFHQ